MFINNRYRTLFIITCLAVLAVVGSAQRATTPVTGATNFTMVPDGQKIKMLGIITSRAEDSFIVTTGDKADRYQVVLTPQTSVKEYDNGIFNPNHRYAASYLLRGLQVKIEGRGNPAGEIVASEVHFREVDLRAAQSLNTVLAPIEDNLAYNTARIGATEENQRRMAGQIEENQALTERAQATADDAQIAADRANNRINGLDSYDPIKTTFVPFATGSYKLSTKAMAIIDEAATWAMNQDANGWMVGVVGFADSKGSVTSNKILSERRANAVIDYMVLKHGIPLTRLIQPFGAGIEQPLADNVTVEGRAQNRRAEIRLMLNKGIADK